MTETITRLTLGLGLLGAPAIAAAVDPSDEITIQVVGEEGAKGVTRQIRLPVPARESKAAPSTDAADPREALSEHRRQVEEQVRDQRPDAAGGAPGRR